MTNWYFSQNRISKPRWTGSLALMALASASIASGTPPAPTGFLKVGSTFVVMQSTVDGATIQRQIDAAITAGQERLVLPGATILLTETLRIPPYARNFELTGQAGTSFKRNTASDFPLISIGSGHPYAFENSSFAALPQTTVGAVPMGRTTFTVTGGAPVTQGSYALIGTDPVEDVVRHTNGTLTYWNKREIVRVISVSNNQVTIDAPTARDYARAELRRLEGPNPTVNERFLARNIKLTNMALDGRSAVDNAMTRKILVVSATENVVLDDLSVFGFSNSAISLMFSRGFQASNIRTSDGQRTSLGYGIEVAASRFITIRNSVFRGHRWGVVFTSGSSDALIEDCRHEQNPEGGFDAGHGTGDRRITYRRCIGPIFSIGNPAFLRGSKDVTLENCTATRSIDIFGNTENIVIDGKHPGAAITTPLIQLFAEQGANAIPNTYTYPMSVTLRNGISERSELDGTNIQLVSVTGVRRGFGSLVAENWTFRNTMPNRGAAVAISRTSTPSNLRFTNCTFQNAHPGSPGLVFGPVDGFGRWNINLSNSAFQTPYRSPIVFISGAIGTMNQTNNTMNGQSITDSSIEGFANFSLPN